MFLELLFMSSKKNIELPQNSTFFSRVEVYRVVPICFAEVKAKLENLEPSSPKHALKQCFVCLYTWFAKTRFNTKQFSVQHQPCSAQIIFSFYFKISCVLPDVYILECSCQCYWIGWSSLVVSGPIRH